MKYIIEADERSELVQVISVMPNGTVYTNERSIDELEELTSDYINEHYGDLQDTAYQRGLDDAWETAKKLFSSMADSDIENAFPIEWNNGGFKALMNLQPQEAIEKLKAYEEKQTDDRIEVGDEVADKGGDKTIVTNIHGELFDGLCSDGSTMTDLFLDDNRKTGRHFDIASILKEMQS